MGEELAGESTKPESGPIDSQKLTNLPIFLWGASCSRECYAKANERSSSWALWFKDFAKQLSTPAVLLFGFVLVSIAWYWSTVATVLSKVLFILNILYEFVKCIPSAVCALFETIVILVFRIKFVERLAQIYISFYCFLENKLEKFIPPPDDLEKSPLLDPNAPIHRKFIWCLLATMRIPSRISCHARKFVSGFSQDSLTFLLASFYTLVWAMKNGENFFGTKISAKFSEAVDIIRARDQDKGLLRKLFGNTMEVSLGFLHVLIGKDVSLTPKERSDQGPQYTEESMHED